MQNNFHEHDHVQSDIAQGKLKLYKLKDFHPEICNLSAESLNGNNFKMLEDAITRIIGVGIDALIVA